MDKKNEKLEELLGRFMNDEQAHEAAEDMLAAEQLLRKNQAPEPDSKLLNLIKEQIAEELHVQHRHRSAVRALKVLAAAAAIIIAATIGYQVFNPQIEPGRNGIIMASSVWESDDLSIDDPQLSPIVAQVEEVEGGMGDTDEDFVQNDVSGVDELEMELLAVNEDFWKGY